MRLAALLLCAAAALAEPSTPPALVRGDLLDCDAGPTGELSVRTLTSQVFRFSFNAQTYFERDSRQSAPGKLRKGDRIEVVSEHTAGIPLAYARTVHVLDPQPARPAGAGTFRPYRIKIDHIIPMGDLTFAGVVSHLYGDHMVLHTRQGEDQTIGLKFDTTYVDNGIVVDAPALKTNMRVFVRGSKNFENEIVAYQIMWGQILEPQR